MQDTRAAMYSIGDFAGFVEYVGKTRQQQDSEKRWRLIQVSDGLGKRDIVLLDRMQIELYRPMTRSLKLARARHCLRRSGAIRSDRCGKRSNSCSPAMRS